MDGASLPGAAAASSMGPDSCGWQGQAEGVCAWVGAAGPMRWLGAHPTYAATAVSDAAGAHAVGGSAQMLGARPGLILKEIRAGAWLGCLLTQVEGPGSTR